MNKILSKSLMLLKPIVIIVCCANTVYGSPGFNYRNKETEDFFNHIKKITESDVAFPEIISKNQQDFASYFAKTFASDSSKGALAFYNEKTKQVVVNDELIAENKDDFASEQDFKNYVDIIIMHEIVHHFQYSSFIDTTIKPSYSQLYAIEGQAEYVAFAYFKSIGRQISQQRIDEETLEYEIGRLYYEDKYANNIKKSFVDLNHNATINISNYFNKRKVFAKQQTVSPEYGGFPIPKDCKSDLANLDGMQFVKFMDYASEAGVREKAISLMGYTKSVSIDEITCKDSKNNLIFTNISLNSDDIWQRNQMLLHFINYNISLAKTEKLIFADVKDSDALDKEFFKYDIQFSYRNPLGFVFSDSVMNTDLEVNKILIMAVFDEANNLMIIEGNDDVIRSRCSENIEICTLLYQNK